MAKQKYSEFADALAAADTLDGTEEVIVMQDGTPAKTTAQDIADLGGGGIAAYSVYTALLSQSGTDAPVATVLQNTLGGTVVWVRTDVGRYSATLSGVFTANKTWCSAIAGAINGSSVFFVFTRADDNSVQLIAYDYSGSGEVDIASGTDKEVSVEIRVYP